MSDCVEVALDYMGIIVWGPRSGKVREGRHIGFGIGVGNSISNGEREATLYANFVQRGLF